MTRYWLRTTLRIALVLALAGALGAALPPAAWAGHLAYQAGGQGEGEKDKPKPDGCSEASGPPECCDGPPECCGGGGLGAGNSEAAKSEPISVVNGREFLTRTDLVVNGVFPIKMTRRYDSQSEYDSPLGYGWAWNLDLRLFEYSDGAVRIRNSCGYHYEFVWTGGAYVASEGRQETLTDDGNGEYTLTFPRGRKARFNADGTLETLEDAVGNRLQMTYDPAGKVDLIGTSPYAVDPNTPMVVARPYLLTQISEVAVLGATGRSVALAYDPDTKRLVSITASDGRVVSYHHDDAGVGQTKGNLEQVDGLEGIVETYTYTDPNDAHNLSSTQLGQGMTPWLNQYDDQDRVVQQTYGDRVITLDYSTPLEATVTRAIADEVGQPLPSAVTVYEYDTGGHLTKRTDALGNEFRYFRDGQGFLDYVEVWQNQGTLQTPDRVLEKAVDYSFGLDGNLAQRSVTLLDTGETITESWEYDHHWASAYQVVSDAAPGKLFRTEYTFYRSGPNPTDPPTRIKEIKRREDDGSYETTLLTYDGNGQLQTITPPEVTPPDQLKVVRSYYGLGEALPGRRGLLKEVYLEVGGARDPHLDRGFTYDARGNVAEVTDARANATSYTWDDRGRLLGYTNARGESTLLGYRGPSLVAPESAPPGEFLTAVEIGHTSGEGEGQVRRLRWDDLGRLRLVERKDDLGGFSTFASYEYDSDGNRRIATDAEGRELEFDRDPLGRFVSVTDDASNTTAFGYDAAGNRTSLTDALGRETEFRYDELDRLSRVLQHGSIADPLSPPLETVFSYDAAGNVTAVIDPRDQTTTYGYNALSRLTSVQQHLGQVVSYGHDARGRLVLVTNARGNELEYGYFPWGGLEKVEHFVDASATEPDRTVSYTYDESGNLETASDTDFSPSAPLLYTITHDPLDRVDVVTAHYLPGGARTLDSGFDRFGNRSALTFTDGAEVLTHSWLFNDLDRLEEATLAGASPLGFSYYANDDLDILTHGNGVTSDWAYYPHGPIQTIAVTGGAGQLHRLAYTPDAVLNVDLVDEEYATGSPAYAYDYDYDPADRLKQAQYPTALGLPALEGFDYDPAGNRELPGDPGGYDYDANNRITTSPAKAYLFDDDGNIERINPGSGEQRFTYDKTNRLRRYEDDATGVDARYLYDPFGRRIKKTVSGVTTWFLWDGDRLLAELDATGARQRRYTYAGGFAPAEMAVPDGGGGEDVYEVHTDHLDTPRVLTDENQSVVWRAGYEAFGNAALNPANTVAFNVRFPGQYYDSESGLHYNFYRTYDPNTGRYLEADPIGQFGLVEWSLTGLNGLLPGLVSVALRSGEPANVYQYARANPLSFIDPLGLDTTFVITRDYGIGSHAAVHVDNGGDGEGFLYDPGGSYVPEGSGRGSGDSFSGAEADLESYTNYHKSTGSTVETYSFATTPEEEAAIAAAAQKQGGVPPPYCAGAVSSAASAAPPFSGLNASIPGPPFGLRSQLKALQKKSK